MTFNYFYVIIKKIIFQIYIFDGFVKKTIFIRLIKGGQMHEQTINIDRMEQAVALFGTFDENIKLIQNEYMVSVVCRGSELKVSGEPENVSKAARAIESLLSTLDHGDSISD